ncbi:P-loop containing nucleoside triphosphate hydrolase protein [Mycena epipterygia]|nr:P-loop containing nucleoside triphosphate hydrolase protein [Mycena epipterygia]
MVDSITTTDKPGLSAAKTRCNPETASETTSSADGAPEEKTKDEPKVPPVSLFALFRFATRAELFLNFIRLIAAGAAGAASPLLTFTLTLAEAKAGSVEAAAQLPIAAANFRRASAKNAIYLTILGKHRDFVTTYIYMHTWVVTSERSVSDPAFFDNVGAGEIVTRIQTDTHLVQQGISEKVALTVFFLAGFVSGFVLAFVRSWRLALVLSTMLPFMSLVGGLLGKFVSRYTEYGGTLAEETISTIRIAHAFGTQETLAILYDGFTATFERGGLGGFYFAVFSSYGLAFSYGITLINRNEAIVLAMGAAGKLFATIDRIPSIDSSGPSGLKPSPVSGALSLSNISFTYPSRPDVPVLKVISLTFPAGTTTALVGASGSGKSTIVALVGRFYDPGASMVRLDGVDVHEINLKYLRAQIGLVAQEPVLFNASVCDNVAYGLLNSIYADAPEAEREALIKEACVRANADAFVRGLPQGYDTIKQRIAIARAIVADPKILLDEATSALDTRAKGEVQRAPDNARKGRTTITIAHRLSMIKDADAIYFMAEDAVLEHGTHNELLADPGSTYAQLVEAQKLRDGKDIDGSAQTLDSAATSRESLQKLEETGHTALQATPDYGLFDLFVKLARLNRESWRRYMNGAVFAVEYLMICHRTDSAQVYPAYAVIYCEDTTSDLPLSMLTKLLAKGIVRRHLGDRTALWMFLVTIGSAISICMQNYLFGAAAASFTGKLRSLHFRAILGQKSAYIRRGTGSLTSNLSDHPQKVKGLIGITLGAFVILIHLPSTIFVWKLGLLVWRWSNYGLACSPLLFFTGYIRLRVIVLKDERNRAAQVDSAQLACEAAASIRTVAALTGEDYCCEQYSDSLVIPLNAATRAARWSALLYAFSQTTVYWVIALIFWYGAVLVSRQECTTFQFFITLMAATFGSMNAGNVFSFAPDLSTAKTAESAMMRLFESGPGIPPHSKTPRRKDSEKKEGHLKFDNVRFSYPTRLGIEVLCGLSFEAKPGQYVALVGASGSGKSTIIQLIERFYETGAGRISLDGVPINTQDIQDYRSCMALVSREPTLYAGTVRFNILLGALKPESEVTQEEIEDVCRDANILEFIQSLPNGFDTEVGGKGSQLSGGQKQRIAIARALMRDPKVLLLDEATSALDSSSEKVVQQALDTAAAGRTTVAIAHRLSTIQNADRIYFIKDGIITESGTHDELLDRNGDYSSFVRLQALEMTVKS